MVKTMTDTTPEKIGSYLSLGLDISWSGDRDAIADCPFCGKEGHLFISQDKGLFTCKVCAEGSEKGGGNIYTFMQKLWEVSRTGNHSISAMTELAADRGLLPRTLLEWGVVRSVLTDEFLFPGYSEHKKIINLYRWSEINGKMRLLGVKSLAQTLFGMQHFNLKKKHTYLCEGPSDAMAVYEALNLVRKSGNGDGIDSFRLTTDSTKNVFVEHNVLGVPGCEQFTTKWAELLRGQSVSLLYDSDHPRKHPKTGALIPSAGYKGMERAYGFLKPMAKEIRIVDWGPDGYDPKRPSGFDMRDLYREQKPVKFVAELRTVFSPEEWAGATSVINPTFSIEALPCDNFKTLINAWQKALRMTEVIEATLSTMLACAVTTDMKSHSDAVWLRVLGPPGSAKSTLCEALCVSQHTFATSVQKGFHSGYVGKGGGSDDDIEKDSSLIPQINKKTVVIKDADTLLTASNRDQILSELRDIYDGTSRAHYRNKKSSVYKGLQITFILAGTKSLRRLNRSYLGDRFLDCVIYDRGEKNKSLEDEILSRAAYGALRRMREDTGEEESSFHDARLLEAMQLTAGYLNWLRENGRRLVKEVECSDSVIQTCVRLGEYISYMRARPDKETEEGDSEVELATRLSSQLVRLANGQALVMNKTSVDDDVMERVVKVARDTSRGISFDIVNLLYDLPAGVDVRYVALSIRKSEEVTRKALQFLYAIGIVRADRRANNSGARGRNRHLWELTPKIRKLHRVVKEYRVINTLTQGE